MGVGWSEQLPRRGVSLNLPGVFHAARDAWKWKRVGWPSMWGCGGACLPLVDTPLYSQRAPGPGFRGRLVCGPFVKRRTGESSVALGVCRASAWKTRLLEVLLGCCYFLDMQTGGFVSE